MRLKARAVLAGLLVAGLAMVAGPAMAEDGGSISFWEMTKVSGHMNSSYNYNFNNPAGGANGLRVFDARHNDFDMNNVQIELTSTPIDWATFHLDIIAGDDVPLLPVGGPAGTAIGVWEAYAELTAPVGNGLTIKGGRFATLLGYEVIESTKNWNTSRSLLFGFAIPFAHTGILATYPFTDQVSATIGVVNAWNALNDTNDGKTVMAQLAVTPNDMWFLSLQGTFGPEQAGSDGNLLGIVDFVGTWAPSEVWTVGLNFDYGVEQGSGGSGVANWWGGALYVHTHPFDFLGFTLRGEYMQDDGGATATAGLLSGANFSIGEGTVTTHFYLTDGWETRFEVRHDHADRAFFVKSDGTGRKFQDTVSLELAYAF